MSRNIVAELMDSTIGKYADAYIAQLAGMAATSERFRQLSGDLQEQVLLLQAVRHYSEEELEAIVHAWREKVRKEAVAAEKKRLQAEKRALLSEKKRVQDKIKTGVVKQSTKLRK